MDWTGVYSPLQLATGILVLAVALAAYTRLINLGLARWA